MTIAEIISLVQDLYPNANTDATIAGYFNLCQNELSPYFGLIAEDTTLTTIANDDEYDLPTGIDDIEQIESLDIYNSAPDTDAIVASVAMQVGAYTLADQPEKPARISVTHTTVGSADTLGTIIIVGEVNGVADTETITPVADSTVYGDKYFDIDGITSITGADWITDGDDDLIEVGVSGDRYDFTRYERGYSDVEHARGNTYYQVYTSAGVKSLVIYPTPTVAGRVIRIRYRKKLTALSTTVFTASPDFDSRFHDMLAIYAAYKIASKGASPDREQANHFAAEYDERLTELWKYSLEKDGKSLKKRTDNRQWH